MYVLVDFIRMGLVELQGTQSKRVIPNEKFLLTVGFESNVFRLRSRRATNCASKPDIYVLLKFKHVLLAVITYTTCKIYIVYWKEIETHILNFLTSDLY